MQHLWSAVFLLLGPTAISLKKGPQLLTELEAPVRRAPPSPHPSKAQQVFLSFRFVQRGKAGFCPGSFQKLSALHPSGRLPVSGPRGPFSVPLLKPRHKRHPAGRSFQGTYFER